MNYFFGKIKEKLNKQTTQQISNVKQIIQSFQISTKAFQKQQVNRRIESICQNCNKWGTYIVNEPSMGLYFCQNHNRRCIEAKAKFIEQSNKEISKKDILLKQMVRTNEEVKEIGGLSNEWFIRIVEKLDKLEKNQEKENQREQQ